MIDNSKLEALLNFRVGAPLKLETIMPNRKCFADCTFEYVRELGWFFSTYLPKNMPHDIPFGDYVKQIPDDVLGPIIGIVEPTKSRQKYQIRGWRASRTKRAARAAAKSTSRSKGSGAVASKKQGQSRQGPK